MPVPGLVVVVAVGFRIGVAEASIGELLVAFGVAVLAGDLVAEACTVGIGVDVGLVVGVLEA